jgi:hypothetical protein
VRTLCGDPPDAPLPEGLPSHTIYEVLQGVESSMLIDLNLSDQNRRVVSKTINLTANTYDFAVNAGNLSMPAFAEVTLDPSEAWPTPVDIVNRASIGRAGTDGRMAVAFYGNPLRAALSWIPQSGDRHALTLWYDKTVDVDGALSDSPPIEDAYAEHLKLQAAAQCRELMKLDVGAVLASRVSKGERQWQQHVKQNGQQGVIKKPSSHPRTGRRVARFQRPGGGFL